MKLFIVVVLLSGIPESRNGRVVIKASPEERYYESDPVVCENRATPYLSARGDAGLVIVCDARDGGR